MSAMKIDGSQGPEPSGAKLPGGASKGAPGLLRGFDRAQTHPFTLEEIDRLVRRGIPGRYALGYRDARGAFRIQHVGYAPWDLNAELKSRVGRSKYFKFRVGPFPAVESSRAEPRASAT